MKVEREEKDRVRCGLTCAGLGRSGAAPVREVMERRVMTRMGMGDAECKPRDLGNDRGYRGGGLHCADMGRPTGFAPTLARIKKIMLDTNYCSSILNYKCSREGRRV